MTQYAYFDSTKPDPKVVQGFYDTDAIKYPNLPAAADLLQLTEEQWKNRMSGHWVVENGALVPYTFPPPTITLAQQAAGLLYGSLAVTSTNTPALSGSYSVDSGTREHIQSEIQCVQLTQKFADGSTSIAWPDTDGHAHAFTVAEFQSLALAITAFAAACFKVINGTSTTLPAASATIP